MPLTVQKFLWRPASLLGTLGLVLNLAFVTAQAQVTGDLRGTIIDQAGAVVDGVEITLISLETGQERHTSSGEAGEFQFGLLRIGAYEARASKMGFSVSTAKSEIRSGEIASIQLTLQPGQVTESVTVSEAVSRLDVENAQMQTSVTGANVQEIPVARNLNLFAITAPGTVPVTSNNPFLSSGSFNVNGMRGRGNNIMVDGITATDVTTTGTGSNLGPVNFSAIKEVKVITNMFSAEFGRNMGAQVQYLTKNGTNNLHGELYEFLRNDKLNARPFFDTSGKANITRRNQYGFELGGPVFIPKLADLRNKTFWHVSYEGLKIRGAGATRIARVPTPAMLSAVTDPTAQALIAQYKLPSSASGSLQTAAANTTNAFQTGVRIDHTLGTRDTLWGRFNRYRATDATSGNTFVLSNLPGFGAINTSAPDQALVAETHIFGAAAVNEFRFGYGKSTSEFPIDTPYPLGPRIQFSNAEVDRFGVWEGFPQGRSQKTYQLVDTFSLSRSRHTFKFGGEHYSVIGDSIFDFLQRPIFTFPTWNDFATGRPLTVQQRFGNSERANRVKNFFLFAQDDFKVSRSLTLNLGMRMEWAGGPIEKNGLISNLDLNDTGSFGAAGSGPFGRLITGQPSFRSNTNWAPRLGFAWSPGNKRTVVRAGYGIVYDFVFLNPITNQRFLPPFIVTATQSGQATFTGSNTFANFVAGNAALQTATKATAGAFSPTAINFGAISPAIDSGLRNPQAHQFNFGVQHDFSGYVLKASYVGTKGNFLQRSRDINFIAPANRVAPATSVADETARLSQFQAANAGLNGNLAARSNRIDGRYNNINYLDSSANSNYHSAQFEFSKRLASLTLTANYTFSKSIDDGSDALGGVLINDSPNMQNPTDFRNNRAVSQFDVRHRAVIAYNWAIPFAKNANSRLLRTALGGWNVSGITSFRSGFPVTLEAGGRRGLDPLSVFGGGAAIRPNAAGPVNINWVPTGQAGAPQGNNTEVAPISAYAASIGLSQPLLGNFGTLGRNSHRLNGERNFDFNAFKNFNIREGAYFQLRGEFYNLFNNTSFQDVNRNISNPAFGQYTQVAQDARIVQVGARFVF